MTFSLEFRGRRIFSPTNMLIWYPQHISIEHSLNSSWLKIDQSKASREKSNWTITSLKCHSKIKLNDSDIRITQYQKVYSHGLHRTTCPVLWFILILLMSIICVRLAVPYIILIGPCTDPHRSVYIPIIYSASWQKCVLNPSFVGKNINNI